MDDDHYPMSVPPATAGAQALRHYAYHRIATPLYAEEVIRLARLLRQALDTLPLDHETAHLTADLLAGWRMKLWNLDPALAQLV